MVAIYSDPIMCWVLYPLLFNFSQPYKLKSIIPIFQIQLIINYVIFIALQGILAFSRATSIRPSLYREKTLKYLTHVIMEASKFKIWRVGWQAREPGGELLFKSRSSPMAELFLFMVKLEKPAFVLPVTTIINKQRQGLDLYECYIQMVSNLSYVA